MIRRLKVSKSCAKRPARRAFSLLELSIVIVIFSTVTVLGLGMANTLIVRRTYSTTQDQLVALDTALAKFYRVYGRLPCPASLALAVSNTNYGLEQDCSALAGTVTWGAVPFRTLNLPASTAVDGYGNRINYVATRLLTTTWASFNATSAGIEVRSGILEQPCSANCAVLADPASGQGAAYLLFSSGADGRGAYSKQGVLGPACYSATTDARVDSQNCAAGLHTAPVLAATVFYDSRYNNGSQLANYFDDIVVWRTKGRI